MWNPYYWNYSMDDYEELGIELPPMDINEEEDEEDEDDDEWEEEEEEEEEDNADGGEVDGPAGTTLRQVLYGNGSDITSVTNTTSSQEVIIVDSEGFESAHGVTVEGERECSNQRMGKSDSKEGGTESLKGDNDEENEGELNRGEIDGLFCPICFEAWSSDGDHSVCCLPCGHIYGLSCIKKWLHRRGSSKCPQCKKKCGLKDIRHLYATRIVTVDGELQKKVQSLEAKCLTLEKKSSEWSKKEVEWKKREADLHKQVKYLKERTHDLENRLRDAERRASGSFASSWNQGVHANPMFQTQGCSNKFKIQGDFKVHGARLFDIDSSSQIFVIARRLSSMGGAHVLTKVSLLSNQEKEDIQLPENTKAVKDLQVSPHSTLVLYASLGKKLSVLCTESNNTVLTYNLPAPAWSCSWDVDSAHYVYTGLQDGTVLQFDLRKTMKPVESLTGLSSSIIHTLYSLAPNSSPTSSVKSVLTASSLGLCQWNFGANQETPYLIPGSENQGVCISLAYCKSNNDLIASYRPKIESLGNPGISQSTATASGQWTRGSHVLYTKTGPAYSKLVATCANVSGVQLPAKSVIVDGVYQNPVFGCGDESTGELVLQDFRSMMVVESLKPQNHSIRDVKYVNALGSGLLSCLSEDSFQLFTAKSSNNY